MFQFRQSIKRIFGIHTRGRNSQTDRRYNVTITSPAQKMSSLNDHSKYNNDSFSNVQRPDKKTTTCLETSEIPNEVNRPIKNIELCTILENKTRSNSERSGQAIFDEDSSNGNTEKYSDSKLTNEHSPLLAIVDCEITRFMKDKLRNDNDKVLNIYGNQAYEEHATDVALNGNNENKSRIKHSYSLDLIGAPKVIERRKLSVETKYETIIQAKGFVDDEIIEL